MQTTGGNYLLQNIVNDYVQKMLTIALREKIIRPSKGPSRPRDCNVV